MAVDRSNFPLMASDETIASIVKGWVRNGLRLKLSYQGITGLSYIEADYVDPERFAEGDLEVTWTPKNIYIPAAPSLFKNLTQSIDLILQELNTIDFPGIAGSLTTTFSTVEDAVKGAEIPELRQEVVGLMADLRETNRLVVAMMDKTKSENGVNIPETIAQVNKTLKRLDKFVSTQQSEVEDILLNIRRTTDNLREFTENLKKHPASIIAGPPAPPEVTR
jgi:paraquat-inducible protein B